MGIRQRQLIAAAALAALAGPAAAACAPDRVDLRDDGASARFTVEVARTPQEQAQGLMNRPAMATSRGMIFVYDAPRRTSFWMRDTLIPLDMIFVDETGTVVKVHTAEPLDETPVPSEAPVVAVLEINGGLAETLGLGEGAELRSPLLPQDGAAWPCEAAD
ncbi:DUF192 domain-containing protein [Jannaschia sp. Os4]|uniref:DUF192 domain-containing protein n=1 Tax=Jannaschia sp. Os4 TaxID=2807617 RepID=UPI001EEDFA05|nr:DUF192 domain-containing protein [Jannaschia sp. Os4]